MLKLSIIHFSFAPFNLALLTRNSPYALLVD